MDVGSLITYVAAGCLAVVLVSLAVMSIFMAYYGVRTLFAMAREDEERRGR